VSVIKSTPPPGAGRLPEKDREKIAEVLQRICTMVEELAELDPEHWPYRVSYIMRVQAERGKDK